MPGDGPGAENINLGNDKNTTEIIYDCPLIRFSVLSLYKNNLKYSLGK